MKTDTRLGDLLALFGACLARAHPDMDEEDVAELIDEIGPERTADLLAKAVEASPMFTKAKKAA